MEGGVSEVSPLYLCSAPEAETKIKSPPLEKKKDVSFPAYRSSFAQHRPPQEATFFEAKCSWDSDGSVIILEACWLDPSHILLFVCPTSPAAGGEHFLKRSVVGNQMARL